MTKLIALLVGGLLAGKAADLISPIVTAAPAQTPAAAQTLGAVEEEYEKLLESDDAAQAEVDRWIRDADAFEGLGAGFPRATLTARVEQRLALVRRAYEDFLRRHPNHVRARIAFGSFLSDTRSEEEGAVQWRKACELDPTHPAAWNNLANYYGHRGPVSKAFECYEKAIQLEPNEGVYLRNLATTTYLFRTDAREYYQIEEAEVFDRALALYQKALDLDPENFTLASDLAQTYYGIKPLRVEPALAAWTYALKTAGDDIERQGVYIHLARIEINAGRFEPARQHLSQVTLEMYDVLKNRLTRNLEAKEQQSIEALPSEL